jgi:hypothetical protein
METFAILVLIGFGAIFLWILGTGSDKAATLLGKEKGSPTAFWISGIVLFLLLVLSTALRD